MGIMEATDFVGIRLTPDYHQKLAQLALMGLVAQQRQQQQVDPKQALLTAPGTGRQPNHSGSLHNAAPNGTGGVSQNANLSPYEKVMQRLRANGQSAESL